MKPFTANNPKRLFRVCEVVRKHLGLGDLGAEYRINLSPEERGLAASKVFYRGWRIEIEFFSGFFTDSLETQLHTIIHEHLHVMMAPYDQYLMRAEKHVARNYVNEFREDTDAVRELVIDHATVPFYRLLEPHIRKVL